MATPGGTLTNTVETKHQEFHRLCRAYTHGESQCREEAWNLIADFAVENQTLIENALRMVQAPASEPLPNSRDLPE